MNQDIDPEALQEAQSHLILAMRIAERKRETKAAESFIGYRLAVMDVLSGVKEDPMRLSLPIFLLTASIGTAAMAIEEPKYEVIKEYEGFEIRRYEPMIVAETEVDGDFDEVATMPSTFWPDTSSAKTKRIWKSR